VAAASNQPSNVAENNTQKQSLPSTDAGVVLLTGKQWDTHRKRNTARLMLLETVLLALVKHVCAGSANVHNFWASITLHEAQSNEI
jgi:hypothetical protein